MVSYWVGVFSIALSTLPSFIGTNWVGLLLSAAFAFRKTWRALDEYLRHTRMALGWRWHAREFRSVALKTDWKAVIAIPLLFWLGNALQIAFNDQQAIRSETKTLRASATQAEPICDERVRRASGALNDVISALRQEASGQRSAIAVLEAQTRSQQNTIDGFGTQIIKATVQPLKIAPLAFDEDTSNAARKTSRWLVLTNQPIQSVHVAVGCSSFIEVTSVAVLGGNNAIGYPSQRMLPNTWMLTIPSPWTPTTPLLIGLAEGSADNLTCVFVPR